MNRKRLLLVFLILSVSPSSQARAEEPNGIDFEKQIRPLLIKRCGECHGPKTQQSDLRLDAKSFAFKGGVSGEAIVPGKSHESELIRRIECSEEAERMPPEGPALAKREIQLLKRWIDGGAKWPESEYDRDALIDPRLKHWAYQPIARVEIPPPSTNHLAANAIDRFITNRQSEQGLELSLPASRRTLIRRLTFDLLGLPPTPEQQQAFVDDQSPDAYAKLVDRLLSSPHYGERWGQHWLDVVRYADTHGFEVNTPRENAWPYRDYVIRAFNEDKPYDRFLQEQIAGDAWGVNAATGFLVAAPVLLPGQIGKDEESKRLARQDSLDEIIVGTSGTFLGLTMGCARCHDHKFDPIAQRDYYAFQAFFAGVQYGDRPLQTEKKKAKNKPQMVYAGKFRKPDETFLLRRGDPEQRVEPVEPAVPAFFQKLELAPETSEQDRRLKLARWITSPNNPLTARVMVNRIWQFHFGRGIVTTSSDFGVNGQRPSHPRLLDWLVGEFRRSGWSVKHIHRLIVHSRTYRQQSTIPIEARGRDDRWWWRFPSRRLEAEAIRDSLLLVSGELNPMMGGSGFNFFKTRGGLTGFPPVTDFGSNEKRRMVYAHKIRMESVPVFGAFDCPDAGQPTPKRSQSTTPAQALNLFNSPFVLERANQLAKRLKSMHPGNIEKQMKSAYRLSLGREPQPMESVASRAIVEEHGLGTLCRVLFNTNEFLFLP